MKKFFAIIIVGLAMFSLLAPVAEANIAYRTLRVPSASVRSSVKFAPGSMGAGTDFVVYRGTQKYAKAGSWRHPGGGLTVKISSTRTDTRPLYITRETAVWYDMNSLTSPAHPHTSDFTVLDI